MSHVCVCVNASCLSTWFGVMFGLHDEELSFYFPRGNLLATHNMIVTVQWSSLFVPSRSSNTSQSCYSSISWFHREWSSSQRLLLLLSGKICFPAFLMEWKLQMKCVYWSIEQPIVCSSFYNYHIYSLYIYTFSVSFKATYIKFTSGEEMFSEIVHSLIVSLLWWYLTFWEIHFFFLCRTMS